MARHKDSEPLQELQPSEYQRKKALGLLPPKKSKITLKQKRFADAYLEDGNGSKAIYRAGYNVKSPDVAKSIASTNLTKVNVIEYLRERAPLAASKIFALSQSAENENVALNASKDILDRSGYKLSESGGTTNTNINVNLEKEDFFHLLEHFGKKTA